MLSHRGVAFRLMGLLAVALSVSAAPQAFTITNAAGEVLTFLPTTTVGGGPSLITVPVGIPSPTGAIPSESSVDEGTMIVSLPVEPTDGTTADIPTLLPAPTTFTATASDSVTSSGLLGSFTPTTPSSSSPSTPTPTSGPSSTSTTSTPAPGAAARLTGAAPAGIFAAIAGFLFL